ncbi:hypothetical protein CHS0354_028699 [Potamilus streckersoni]|uniref:Fucolectin tachylectin-4 pentraxin-1 domain-containing protein n=1 Tax=Potamilus streckersoni TaxID=2493646 RepID=A0AAE0SM99_9BIVA|nr:hypothetical protein CHS0354_028699 [Potamilus streckersoni]
MLFVLGLKNFAVNKLANQSSTLNYSSFLWTADKAVDGNITGERPEVSKTCSATNHLLDNHTWEVDIGFLIVVKTIIVHERSDKQDQLSGFKVFIGNTTKSWTMNQHLVKVQQTNASHTFRVNGSLARFVSVIRQNSNILTICEVIVDGECQKGTFGDVCNETCGNCLNGSLSCNSITGQCIDGCERGWSGITCKEGCKIGAYGYGCNETCGLCFSGNNSCSAIDGQCKLGCEAGWKGRTCKLDSTTFNKPFSMCCSGNNGSTIEENDRSVVKVDDGTEHVNRNAIEEHTVTIVMKLVACVLVATVTVQRLMDTATLVAKLGGGEQRANKCKAMPTRSMYG